MNRPPVFLAIVLAACLTGPAGLRAQARGPSAAQIRQQGQQVQSLLEAQRQQWEQDWGEETKARRREEMRRDQALSASRLAEVDAFLRRLPGRYRIEGKIERQMQVSITTGLKGPNSWILTPMVPKSANVSGVTDCAAIGHGPGVNCIISASWPIFDRVDPPPFCPPFGGGAFCELLFGTGVTASEMLDTLRPAVLMLGLDTDPPQLRGMLVSAETLMNEWAGEPDGDHARMLQTKVCTTLRCYPALRIDIAPAGDVVTFTLRQTLLWDVTLTLTMHRDPDAQLEKSLRPMRVR